MGPRYGWKLRATCAATAALFGALAATAQQTTCGPAQIDGQAGFVPTMQAPYLEKALDTQLRAGYREIYASHNLEQAKSTLTTALHASEDAKNSCAEALAAYGLAVVADRIAVADTEKWLHRAEAAFIAVHSDLGIARTHFMLAALHSTEGKDAAVAKEYAQAAIELDHAGAHDSAIAARLGAVPVDERNADRYAELQRQAQALKAPCEEAQVLRLWGDQAFTRVDYQDAMEHYEAADRLYALCPASESTRASLQTSMGRLERSHGRAAAALPHYRFALRLQQQSGDPSYIPQTYNAMAVAYHAMGDNVRAIAHYKLGLAEAEKIHSQPFVDFLRANLGAEYLRIGQPALGIPLLEGATKNLRSDQLICRRNAQLADAYRRTHRYEESLQNSALAIAACERVQSTEAISTALNDRAKTELQLDRLEEAHADSQRCLQLLEELSAHLVQQDAYKQGYVDAEQTRDDYNTAIDVLMRMHRYTEALETAEQGRSRAFLDLLTSEQADGKPLQTEGSKAYRTSLNDSRQHSAAFTVEQMLSEAGRLHSTLLVYWISKNALYTWVVTPGHAIAGFSQPMTSAALEKMVKSTLPLANSPVTLTVAARGTTSRTHGGVPQWRTLYSLLIAPVEPQLPQEQDALLTIVPSGPLFQLSFAALMDQRGHYLLERYRMHTIPTVGLLQFTQRNLQTANDHKSHYLFVAGPAHLPSGPDGKPLPALSGTGAEVNAIARLLPAAEVERLQGGRARQGLLETRVPQATLVHFATHAVVDDVHPEKTFLALDTQEDTGRLTLSEVYGLNLHTRLVVLSACRTGLGKITGDGVMGLSRAFFYAGSASVLTTLWDVADEPTAVMLPTFYRSLLAGNPPSDSLRTAQLQMLHDLRRGKIKAETLQGEVVLPASPAYWAAFVLSGEP